jgi:hypothetical protein
LSESAEAYRAGLGFSGSAVVAQIRAAATDLLGIADRPHARTIEPDGPLTVTPRYFQPSHRR